MHEAGIARSILDISIETALKNSARKITTISVRIGQMSAVDEASLRFAFDALKAGGIASEAVLEYECVPLTGRCLDCGFEEKMEGRFAACSRCRSGAVTIISGDELEVAYIEAE